VPVLDRALLEALVTALRDIEPMFTHSVDERAYHTEQLPKLLATGKSLH